MKKIIFAVINMNVGGVEKALLNMLSEIPKDKYDVTVLMLEEYGGFLENIPDWVNVRILEYYDEVKQLVNDPPQLIAKDLYKNKKYLHSFNILFNYIISKLTNNMSHYYKYVLKKYNAIEGNYDIAIAYHGPMDFISYLVIHKINARKKYQWVHFDVTTINMNHKFVNKLYKKFNKILVVSKDGREKFINLYPKLKKNTDVFTNIISEKLIKQGSKEGIGFNDNFNGIRILTVGRLCMEKGQDLIIPVLAKLKKDGYDVRWYCVGEGSARSKYENIIKHHNVEDDFILLGSDTNPYKYMNQCDIYVQPSRYEGYCITLAEARCLNKPIVATNFTGSKEQLEHNKTGLIVDINENEIYLAVKSLIDNIELRKELSDNLKKENFNMLNNMESLV